MRSAEQTTPEQYPLHENEMADYADYSAVTLHCLNEGF
jgi:hypothetical protein